MPEPEKKVLYIEDDPSTRLLVKRILADQPFQYYEASTGIKGLKLARKIAPDLIIMVFQLPDLSGAQLATKIKSIPQLKNTVIVALTGASGSHSRELSLIAGCDGYITKPIDIKEFPNQISEFLQGKRERIAGEKREEFRQRYEEALVDNLTGKVKQLQKINELLEDRTDKLNDYSAKLETLLHVIIRLQMCNSPQALRKCLVQEVCKQFKFDRCAFLEVDHEKMRLNITDACGFQKRELDDLNIKYEMRGFQKMFREDQILFFSSPPKNADPDSQNALQKVQAHQFVFGILGTAIHEETQLPAADHLRRMLASLIPNLYDKKETDIDIIREQLREYLSSDIFYVGGYLFIDYKDTSKHFTNYDIKILEMLLRTSGLLYQNLQMRDQLKELFIRAEKDAITDHLTGLYNFRYFTQQLSREVNRARRHNSPFAVLMMDIDFFKIYNDTLGHQAGDLVLKKVAKLLFENTRSSDFVARYGGEEFVIICPELNKAGGKKIATKLCHMIADTYFPQEEKLPHGSITISIGVAAYPEDARTEDDLICNADAALYQAKQSGRNRVQLHETS